MRKFLMLLLIGATVDVADLVKQLGDDDFDTREKAGKLLEEQGEKARESLTKATKESDDVEIRKRAGELLATLDRKAEGRILAEKLKGLKDLKTPPFDPKTVKQLVEKKGKINGRETWTADNSYHITGEVIVGAGASLTVDPGAVVLVNENASISVTAGGNLIAKGEADRPIVVTCIAERDGKPGHWGPLTLTGQSIELAHVQVRRSIGIQIRSVGRALCHNVGIYETKGTALTLADSSPVLSNLTIRDATEIGLASLGNAPTLTDVTISRCKTGVLVKDGAYPTITNLRIAEITEDAIRVRDGSYPRIASALVADAGTGLRVEDGSYPRLFAPVFADLRGDGVVVEGGSYPTLLDAKIAGAVGVGLVVKGGSYPTIGNIQATDCKKGNQQVDPSSRIRPPQVERRREP